MTDTTDTDEFGPPVSEFVPEILAREVWRDRVTRSALVDPTQLLGHELNPRFHPSDQQRAMLASYERLGQIGGVLVNERNSKVINGHMRVSIAISEGALIRVDYLDLDEEEEAIALAVYDQIGRMAGIDQEQFSSLIETLPNLSDALTSALDAAARNTVTEPPRDETDPGPGGSGDVTRENTDTFLFGFVRWQTTRVDCSGEETTELTRLYTTYLSENDGDDKGFVGWLTQARTDSNRTG